MILRVGGIVYAHLVQGGSNRPRANLGQPGVMVLTDRYTVGQVDILL
jgi:hypothetical protein